MRRLLLVAVGLALAAWLLTGVAQVQPGERAVVRRFGRVVAEPGPGLWVGLPAGIDRIDRVAVGRVRQIEVGADPAQEDPGSPLPPGQFLTGDQNLVNAQLRLDYTIRESALADYVVAQDRAEEILRRLAESAVAEWAGGRGVDEVILTGKSALPDWLVPRVKSRAEPYRLGLEVQSASVLALLPPAEVKPAFDAVAQAETGMRTADSNARQRAERLLADADIEEGRQLATAAAYAAGRKALAQAEADAFRRRAEQYHRLRVDNPDVLASLWHEEMGRLFGKLAEGRRLDWLDSRLGPDGLDVIQFGPNARKR
jgi:membrane protease subunit HflK